MAYYRSTAAILLLLALITAATADDISTSLSQVQELDAMMEALRVHGYVLFTNAITTSDLHVQLLSSTTDGDITATSIDGSVATTANSSFTIFAPKDSLLYSLDMASDAAAYVSTLCYHVSPNRRLTLSDLRNLKSPFLETLLPHYSVLVSSNKGGRRNGDVPSNSSYNTDVVRVDGVVISAPDLYTGSRIVVHGLDGILLTGIVKNEDLIDDRERLGFISAPAEAPLPEVEFAEEIFQEAASPVDSSIVKIAPPIKPPVTTANVKGLKTNKRGKHHHHPNHHNHRRRRSRARRRHNRNADHRKDDL